MLDVDSNKGTEMQWFKPVLGLLFIATAAGAQANPRDVIRREVEAQTRAMSAAFVRGDMNAVAQFYADDAEIYTPGGHVVSGRRELDRFWRKVEDPVSWTMTTVEAGGSTSEPHHLVESVMIHGRGQDRSVSRVYCLFLWRRDADGRLRVKVDMYTPMR
jgi:ketosteroid isomerase-like protein